MQAIRGRDAIAAAVIALAAGLLTASPALELLKGLSLDALTALRWRAIGARHDPASSPAVVIAFDEESYRVPPFKGSPTVTWTGELGRVIAAVVEGGARVIGFDVVFAASIEESGIPFGNETLGGRLRGFDRDFLRALALPARAGKIVLGRSSTATSRSCRRRASGSLSASSAISVLSTSIAIPMRSCAECRSRSWSTASRCRGWPWSLPRARSAQSRSWARTAA
jgi:hypothetical protein